MCKCFISHSHFHVLKAPIIAELAGYGLSGDAYHISSPPVDGDGAVRAMRTAIADANMVENLDDISYVNAHATSTPTGDVIEANAIHGDRIAIDPRKRYLSRVATWCQL